MSSRSDRTRSTSMRIAASVLVIAVLVFALAVVRASAAPKVGTGSGGGAAEVRPARVLERDRTGVASPVGLAFSSASDSFYVVDARPDRSPVDTDVVKLTPFELSSISDRAGSVRIAAVVEDPVNMAFDARRSRLLLLDTADRLLEVQADASGDLDPGTLVRRDAVRFGLKNPQGIAVDPSSGTVFILDAAQPRIVRVEPAPDGSFETATTSEIDLRPAGLTAVRGLAFDPATGHLHLGVGQTLVELTTTGDVTATRDLRAAALAKPQGMVFAPSGDQTDDPSQLSLYLADSGTAATGFSGPTPSAAPVEPVVAPSAGQIVELSLAPQVSIAAIDFTATLVRTIDTAAFSPPSPDPSGLTYLPNSNTLLMVDGEVEETVNGITHFQGVNVWEMTLSGSVVDTANISKKGATQVPMTDEPVGVTWKPSNGHYFVTEDGGKRVYDLNPGGDGNIGTNDDTFTFFSTNGVGNGDPEGITYDTQNDRLFVADGVNAQIYEYTTAGALVSQFDVQQYGVGDPETVEFNSASGTLFVLSNRQSGPIIIETTRSGALLQTVDVSAAPEFRPAGLAYAPASNGSGVKRFYWADREIDNNNNPNIIDGKIFEFTAPGGGGPPGNQAPSVNAGADRTITLPARASLDGTVSDDGRPNPPARVTTTWSKVSGPGTVTFGDASSVDTTATFSTNGTYVLRLEASDSLLTSSDTVTVTVNAAGSSPLYFSLRVAATVGGVSAANEDILFYNGTSFSLAFDGSDVGLSAFRIDAFSRLDATTLLLSFDAAGAVPGIVETVDDSDIVRFRATSLGASTAGTFSFYFDGSDVGLTADAQDVDAVELLPNGHILLSTTGAATVSGVAARDEDLLVFTPTSTGDVTAGSFAMYFDGSDVWLGDANEDVDAAAVDGSGKLYLSALDFFAVSGVSGSDEDVFVFTPTSTGPTTAGTYSSALYFDGSAFGLTPNDVLAIDLP